MRKILLVLILLIAVDVGAVQLDSVRQVRVQVYNMHGLDTTGVGDLPTNTVDEYVNFGIQELNEDLAVYRRQKKIVSTDGKRFYAIDSMIQIIACFYVSNDSIIGLSFIDLEQIDQRVFDAMNETDEDKPIKFSIWGDSLWLMPTPIAAGDTFLVLYNNLIPQDSIRLVPTEYRMGIVYYAVYLAAKDLGLPPVEQQALLADYMNFVATKKAEAKEQK